MARYGIDFYGSNVYGSPSFVDFDATPFEVLPYGPGENQLQWSIPVGDWTRLRLVRNAYGWPVHEDDGRILVDLNMGPSAIAPLDAPQSSFLDTDLQTGRLYYYSIFVLAWDSTNLHTEWRRAADSTGISVGKYDYTERMLYLLPEAYWADPTDPSGRNDQLVRFMSVFGFQLDHIRTQYETLRNLHNPDKIAAALLGPLGDMFGVTYEPEIGARQHRSMVRNAVYINRRKSTLAGTNTLVSSFTGWDAQISVGTNQMLDYNDSSFEEILGRWETVNNTCTLVRRASDGTVAAFSASDFTNKQLGMLQLTSKSGGDISAACGLRKPVTSGVPMKAGAACTFSAYFRTAVTGRSNSVLIRFLNARGVTISDSAWGSNVTSVTTGWTRASVSATAPAGTVYAVPLVRVLATTTSEVHYVDAAQFELGSSATTFQEARDIRIVLSADRVNQVLNPSGEIGTTGWTATGATLTRDTTVAYSGAATATAPVTTTGAPAAASFKLTSTSAGTASLATATGTSAMPVRSGQDYTLSAYYLGPVNVVARIGWYDVGGNLLNETVGQSFNWVPSSWIRPNVSGTAPDNAYYARVLLQPVFTATSQVAWIDDVLFERTAEVRPYFDASQFGSRPADNIWEGTVHASRSHYYFNRTAKQYRLDALLNDYLVAGTTHTLLVAQPFVRVTSPVTEDPIPGTDLLLADSTLTATAT